MAGEPIRAKEGKVWLGAASALTASVDEAEHARLLAVAEAPGGTGSFRRSNVLSVLLRVLIQPFLVASRLPPLGGAPLPEPSQLPRDATPTAPPSAAKKGKKREVPHAEVPVAPLAHGSPVAAPQSTAPKSKKPPPPRPVRKTGCPAPAAPPSGPSPPASSAGFVVLQECLHTSPDAVPVVGHGQFPPSAPYYIVRIRVSGPFSIPRLLLTRCV